MRFAGHSSIIVPFHYNVNHNREKRIKKAIFHVYYCQDRRIWLQAEGDRAADFVEFRKQRRAVKLAYRAGWEVFYRGRVDIVAHCRAWATGGERVHLLVVQVARGRARAAGKGVLRAVFDYVVRGDVVQKINVAGAVFGARELFDRNASICGEIGAGGNSGGNSKFDAVDEFFWTKLVVRILRV